MRGIDFEQLTAFAAVAELGSFSSAAERLHLTQPAVSVRVRQLERRLDVRLLDRVGRRIEPTVAGHNLLPHIQRIDEAMQAAIDAVAEHVEGIAGRVRIGTGATACIYLLPPALRDLRQRFPRLDIIVRTGNTPDILSELQANALDVAIVTLPAAGRAFETETLVEDEIVAVFPPGLAAPSPVTAPKLASLPVLLYEPGGNARRIIDDWFRRAGVALKPAMELGNIEAIKQLIGAGLGCGLLPRLAVADETASPGVAIRSLAPVLHRRLGLVLRRGKVPDRGLRETIAVLRGLAGGYSDLENRHSRESGNPGANALSVALDPRFRGGDEEGT